MVRRRGALNMSTPIYSSWNLECRECGSRWPCPAWHNLCHRRSVVDALHLVHAATDIYPRIPLGGQFQNRNVPLNVSTNRRARYICKIEYADGWRTTRDREAAIPGVATSRDLIVPQIYIIACLNSSNEKRGLRIWQNMSHSRWGKCKHAHAQLYLWEQYVALANNDERV